MEQPSTHQSSAPHLPKLSICIPTINRAEFLRATVEKIIPQLTEECEVLIVDNASKDNTSRVADELLHQSKLVRYVRKDTNNGVDSNVDRAIELARGEYCWITADDDFFKPGAVAAVLDALRSDPSAVLVNYEFRDFTMSKVLQEGALDFDTDRIYGAWEADRMFVELQDSVRYIGALVMKRATWLSRQRDLYFGSGYAFVGMIYQERLPQHVHVIAKPYVSYRFGNESTFQRETDVLEVLLCKWPSLVASFPLTESSKRTLHSAQPWRHPYEMLVWRGIGLYGYQQYRRLMRPQLPRLRERLIPLICLAFPRSLANFLLIVFLSTRGSKLHQLLGFHLAALKSSPFYLFGLKRGEQRNVQGAPSTSRT